MIGPFAMRARTSLLGLFAALASTGALADEGQWPPGMLDRLGDARLRSMGLERPVTDLWSEDGGLVRAVVNFGGCSGAFISEDGLFATNHHCAYGGLQAASTVEHDYLKDGFVAKTRADEIPARGRSSIRVLERIEDVTEQIRAAAATAPDDEARTRAVEQAKHDVAEACEAAHPGRRCEVAEFFFGARYELHTYLELKDVRLVFAPPSAVGEYGGEVDNWMWPRHSGDFTLLRAYVGADGEPAETADDNVPYRPEAVLEVGHEGVAPGDFVAILGYPGRTRRYLWSTALEHHVNVELPAIIDLYGEWLDILRAAEKQSRALAIKVAALKKGLANRHKNARGMRAGIARMGLLERRAAEAQAMLRAVKETKDLEGAQALSELRRMSAAAAEDFERSLLLEHVSRGPRMLWVALSLVRRADAQALPDAERRPEFQDRNAARLEQRVLRAVADYDAGVESALLASWLGRARALKGDAALAAFRSLGPLSELSDDRLADALLAGTRLRDPEFVEGAFARGTPENLRQARDVLLRLARALAPAFEAHDRRVDRRAGALVRLAPDYLRLLRAVREGPLYPDANGTLRVSVANVKGYSPRDGLFALPQTTLEGQLAKHTGEAPFDLPARVREAATAAKASYFADPELEDVPVCFLANGDTTGGNSGSPVVDGRGRWVGLNFDRVWENIAGDVAYNPPQSRNVSVDVRYVLWLLSITPGTERISAELGVTDLAKRARRAPAPPAPEGAATAAAAPSAESSCRAVASGRDPTLWTLGLVLFAARRRRAPTRRSATDDGEARQ